MQAMRLLAHQRPSHIAALQESGLALRPRLHTISIASADLDPDETYAIGDSPCSCEHPLPVERLAQRFVLDTHYVPCMAERLLDPSELPPALEGVAMHAQRSLQTWLAWTNRARIWFVVAEVAKLTNRHREGDALRIFFYDDEGRFVSWGTWALHSGGWTLCER
jgi:hypothetical protein